MKNIVTIAFALVLGACHGVPTTSPPIGGASTVRPPDRARPRVVRGRVVGHDGEPAQLAHLRRRDPNGAFVDPVVAKPDGTFEIPIPANTHGIVAFEVTGVGHRPSGVLVVAEEAPVDVDVRLGTYMPTAGTSPVEVVVWQAGKQVTTRAMTRTPDGTYVADVPVADGTYGVDIRGLVEHESVGADAGEGWEYDGARGYRAVRSVAGGRLHVRFDPAKLPPETAPKTIAGIPGSITERIEQLETARMAEMERSERAWKHAMLAGEDLSAEAAAEASAPYRKAVLAATGDPRPLVRQFATLAYFSAERQKAPSESERRIAKRIVDELSPDDPMWRFGDGSSVLAVAERPAYTAAVIERHPSTQLVASLLVSQVSAAKDDATRRRLVAQMRGPRFAQTVAPIVAERVDPDRLLAAGKTIPRFEVPALRGERSNGTHSAASLTGKVYLLDIWATWCVPCVAELPKLHEIHAKYGSRKGKRLEIVSVSLDDDPTTVAKFRADKAHPMPWLHGIAGTESKNNPFYTSMGWAGRPIGVPFLVLVDEKGKILSASPDLSLDQLPALLDRALQ